MEHDAFAEFETDFESAAGARLEQAGIDEARRFVCSRVALSHAAAFVCQQAAPAVKARFADVFLPAKRFDPESAFGKTRYDRLPLRTAAPPPTPSCLRITHFLALPSMYKRDIVTPGCGWGGTPLSERLRSKV